MDAALIKKELRKAHLAKRMAMTDEEVAFRSRQIFEKWRNRFSIRKIGFLHVFKTMHSKHEVETQDYFDLVHNRHPQVNIVVPVVDPVNKVLRHALVHEEVEMEKNRFGIPEPKVPVSFLYPVQIDMVIVPMLAFDDKGHRLGYGAGLYDRFLALTRPSCIKIGVCFEANHLKEFLPVEPHDVPLDFVITEVATFRYNPNFPI